MRCGAGPGSRATVASSRLVCSHRLRARYGARRELEGLALSNANAIAAVAMLLSVIAFWGYCLLDFTRTNESDMRIFSRPVWLLNLLFTSLFGSLMWWYYGRVHRP